MIDQSLWRAASLPRFDSKPVSNDVDVVIVGGGITGLTAAYLLKKSGKRVAVFERDRIGSGDTGNTTAHVTYVTDASLQDIDKQFGKEAARLVWEGGAVAIDLIESNVEAEGIDCGFRRVPNFICSPFLEERDDAEFLRSESELAADLGFSVRFVARGPITGKSAMAVADQAIYQPLEYIAGLARAVHGDGCFVCEQAEVSEMTEEPLSVTVNGEKITFRDLIVATHVPVMGTGGMLDSILLQTKIYPYSTYAVGGYIDDETLMPGLYNDTSDPYYFLRVHDHPDGRYAILGGADHKTGQETDTDASFAQVVDAFRKIIPSVRIDRRWSGQVMETDDGLPFIGQTAPHQYSATGYTGNGMTFGTLSGLILHDAIMGVPNPWSDLFDPNRKAKSPSSIATYITENVDYPFYFIADRLRRNKDGAESVRPGEGKVLNIGGRHVACHRTRQGELVKVSAVCTHMGCLVRWNRAEETWDCPCHGSRFKPDGEVLGGPAESPLEKIT